MTRIELGTGVGAQNFNPTDFSYQRETKDGDVPIISYLLGSHFNENLDGLFTLSNTGTSPTSSAVTVTGGKLNIQIDAVDETGVTKRATHSTFSYLWPKTQINSNLELATEQVGEISPNVAYDQIARTTLEDLATGDQINIELHSGNSGAGSGPATRAYLVLTEKVSGVITELGRVDTPSGEFSIDWQLKFLEEGVTKFLYKTNVGEPIVLWKGDLKADVAECKVFHEIDLNEAVSRTVKFDFIWIVYKSIFAGFDVPVANKMLACVCIWDTNNTTVETDWQRVYSKDHLFHGEKVIENGLIRLWFKPTPTMEVYAWQTFGTPAWVLLGSLTPKNSNDNKATTLIDVIIRKYNDTLVILDVNYGIVTHTYRLAKGMAYVRCNLRSKKFDFVTTKERFALSSDSEEVNLLKWNQMHSDDDTRGNPLGTYTPGAVNPAVFTFDQVAATGLGHVDDVWFAFYNPTNDDVVGWIGTFLKPNALEVEATDINTLKEARFGFDQNIIIAIGALNSKPMTKINGKPQMFFPGIEDEYVKWKSNAAIFAIDQNPFVRKRR